MHAEQCPVCYGKGVVPDEIGMGSTASATKTCHACQGRGYIFVPDPTDMYPTIPEPQPWPWYPYFPTPPPYYITWRFSC